MYVAGGRLEVHTDASSLGLGGVLYQEQTPSLFKPISYYSRKTTPDESKYSAVELEVLAIVACLEKWRVYLLGVEFTIKTDCNSIKLLAKKKDLNSRVGRWFVRLSEYSFMIEHVKGANNLVADALSRYPVGDKTVDKVYGITLNTDWVAALQRADERIMKVRDLLELGDEETFEKCIMYKSRVYRTTKNRWRLYVPQDLVYDVIRDAHEAVAHQGIDKTMENLKRSFYFPNMRDIVTAYLNRCIKCLYYKQTAGKHPGYLHPLEKGKEPFVTIHYDHVGPYVKSKNRNQYVGVIVDGFSKYVMLGALTDVGAESTIALLKLALSNYGKPDVIITDRGTAFTAAKFELFCEAMNIKHVKVASGSARSNGQVEIVNKQVTRCLAKISTGVECYDWDEKLLEVQVALNNTVHSVTKTTPSEVIFRHPFRNFSDNPLVRELKGLNKQALEDGRINDDDNVSELLDQNRARIKNYYDQRCKKPKVLGTGNLVMLHAPKVSTGESRKLLPTNKGPYEIVKPIGNDRYLIQDIEGEQQSSRIYKAIVAIDRLELIGKTSKNGDSMSSNT